MQLSERKSIGSWVRDNLCKDRGEAGSKSERCCSASQTKWAAVVRTNEARAFKEPQDQVHLPFALVQYRRKAWRLCARQQSSELLIELETCIANNTTPFAFPLSPLSARR